MSPTGSKNAPEAKAREQIDRVLQQAGWIVQDRDGMNLTAGEGIAVREFGLEKGHGFVDYLLFVDGMFMRSVHSRVLFEQMKGRGVRVINPDDLRAVTPDAKAKTHFLIVDCVGVTEKTLSDTKPLEKNPSLSLKVLLDHVAAGGVNDD
jgi:type I site-specific restriction endonuclease